MSNQFYNIRNPWKRGYYYGKIVDYIPGLGKRLFLGDFSDNIFPKMKLMSGTKAGDFMYTDAFRIKCVSEKVKKAFEENNISGWKVYDIEVVDSKGKPIEGYFGLSVTGRIKHFDTDTTYIEQKVLIPFREKLNVKKGLSLNLSEWDKTDIFAMEDKSYIFVNSKVAKVFQRYRFTNVELGKIGDINMPILK